MKHVADVVTKAVNFIRARALNHRQFVALLEEHKTEQVAQPWKVLQIVWDLKSEIQKFCVFFKKKMQAGSISILLYCSEDIPSNIRV